MRPLRSPGSRSRRNGKVRVRRLAKHQVCGASGRRTRAEVPPQLLHSPATLSISSKRPTATPLTLVALAMPDYFGAFSPEIEKVISASADILNVKLICSIPLGKNSLGFFSGGLSGNFSPRVSAAIADCRKRMAESAVESIDVAATATLLCSILCSGPISVRL